LVAPDSLNIESVGKIGAQTGSVENLFPPEDHDVVGDGHEPQFPALAVVGTTADVGSLSSLDHGDDGFDLGSSAISVAVESSLHESTVTACGGLGRRSAVLGGNDRPDAVLVAGEAMIGLGVEPGVGRQLAEPDDAERFAHEGAKLVDVRPRSAADATGEDEMIVDVADDTQLGKAVIHHAFPGAAGITAATDEVAAG
jgi:hypothetical protein